MLKKDTNYRRLKLGGRGWLGQSSYWLGPNHLLVVEVANYVERYRRFYFRDVQAIIVQHSPVRLGWNIGFGAFAFLALAGLLSSGLSATRDTVILSAWLIALLCFSACLITNTLRGPSCSVHLRTAVQTQKLPGVGRWRKADALVAALSPSINAVQGTPAVLGSLVSATTETPGFIVDDPNAPPRILS